MGKLEEALSVFERGANFQPESAAALRPGLAVTFAHLGRVKEAQKAIEPYIKMGIDLRCMMRLLAFKDPKIEKLFADGFLKAGVLGEPGGYYNSTIFQERSLTEKELKDLFFGQTVSGFDICSKKEWWMEYTEEGKVTFRDSEVSDIGRSWVEGNKLCNQWENRYGGFKDCMRVFINSEGTDEMKDHYIGTTVYGLVPFSVMN
jgi:hypothetical protein